MEFIINKINTEKLNELVKISQSITDITTMRNLYVMTASENKLKASAYGNGNILEYSVDISSYIGREEKSYFYVDILQLIQAIEKVCSSSQSNEVKVSVKNSKLVVSQGTSKITINMFDSLSTTEYIEADQAFETKNLEIFKDDSTSKVLKVTPELVEFSNTIGKFISFLSSKTVSGLLVNKNKIYYSDHVVSVIEKRLSYNATKEPLYISFYLFNFLANISKIGDFDVVYSENSDFIKLTIPELNLSALIAQPSIVFEYPTKEEIASMTSAEDNRFEIEIDTQDLLSKLNAFDGVFPSSLWQWKDIDFTVKENNTDMINLYHSSDTAEVDIDLPIKSLNAISTQDGEGNPINTYSFKISSLFLAEYLSKFNNGSDGTTYIDVSPLSTEEEHGICVRARLLDENKEEIIVVILTKILSGEVI